MWLEFLQHLEYAFAIRAGNVEVWFKVRWRGPNETRTQICSYCGTAFPDDDDDFMPLMLWSKDGHAAEFCETCQRECFGVWSAKDGD